MEDVLDEWETAVQQLQTDPSGSASVRNWKLGLVIDLTNTSRYYQTTDLKKKGIKHVKIQCRGRDAVLENASVNTFVYEAIKFFFEARPPGIYKPDDIDALYAFYHERRPESLVCPPTPEWKRSSDLYLNGEATADDDDDDDDGAPTALLVRGHAQFPGSHPVSLNRTHLSRMGRGWHQCFILIAAVSKHFLRGYVGIHSSGFRNFLLKPELLRSIVDSGFEHPFELRLGT
ncbi:hypothetical protein E1A91_A09G059000v1 [Gossypium mustelinum]|uniref:Uncharacterized protein n=1 Tax=Gossypium mustelinum TaxID=34275 RepID=A0A5D2XV58_GOSMU|nr:hypothetical protein E1A91_A09G059000v1 [Gossypium mustelinum]